jgi:hypothetical protein
MPYKILIIILFLLFIMMTGGVANTQVPPQNLHKDIQTEPQPEIPSQVSTVIVKNNLLSVEFYDTSFGEIIRKIGDKAGFNVEGSSKGFSKKLTVKFHDLDIDRGIMRLFSLVKESNYLINYNEKGLISRLKIHNFREVAGSAVGSVPTKTDGSEIRRLQRRQVQRPINPQLGKDPSL